MTKDNKKTKVKSNAQKSTSSVVTQETVPVTTQVSTPVTTQETTSVKKVTKKATKKTAQPVVTDTVAPQTVVESVPENVVLTQTEKSDQVSTVELTNELYNDIQQLGFMLSSIKNKFRVMEKKHAREIKHVQKINAKRKMKGNRQPSGFVKPTLISNELATFLNKPLGSEMARTEVTRDINTYIRANSLQCKKNGRKILPDEKLKSLLKLQPSDELTYFNLQRYMKVHFLKKDPESGEVSAFTPPVVS